MDLLSDREIPPLFKNLLKIFSFFFFFDADSHLKLHMFTRSKATLVLYFMSFAGKGNFLAAAQGPSVCFTLIDGISRTTLPGQFKPGQAGSGRAAPRSYSGHRWKKLHKHQFFSKGGSAAVSPLPGILRMGRALVKKNLQINPAAAIHYATCGTSPCSRRLSKQRWLSLEPGPASGRVGPNRTWV